ncbi:hypothetical protein AYO20_04910 [Fonsecaea nubica]|uniref:F-box domain-containing protein n=1 Tax=Fonsecaea nubica TaxID=856822 RepID=A0A178D0S2_9EURO|nr:hypothetical protein AYO20_04910 [Fonsecaea nubica]OAL35760.1 hypothetical protein AYO20_04910 [Fonsecaea nubica]
MAASSRKQFGILTTEDLSAITTALRQEHFNGPVDTIPRLPDEVLLLIFSRIITNCIYLYQEGYPDILRSTGSLRQVCRRFRNLVDELMLSTPLRRILLIGPISGNYTDMTTMYQEYRNSLWTRLGRPNAGVIPLGAVVHFYPCLDVNDSVNWFRDNNLLLELKDILAVQEAITAHHIAALILSRIMQEVIRRQFRGHRYPTLGLVFHEVDGSWFRGNHYFEERHRQPDFLPFWDSKGMQLILREWRWIFRRPNKSRARRIQVILPNVAWATNSAVENEAEAANICVAELYQAWAAENDVADMQVQLPNPLESQAIRRNIVYLPGFPGPIRFPTDSLYARWLGTTTEDALEIFAFTIRALVVGVERDGALAIIKQSYRPLFESIESAGQSHTQTADLEKMRQHQAVRLTR